MNETQLIAALLDENQTVVARATAQVGDRFLCEFEETLTRAASGSEQAAAEFVDLWRAFREVLLFHLQPSLVAVDVDGGRVFLKAGEERLAADWLLEEHDRAALRVADSKWVRLHGPGLGSAVAAIQELKPLLGAAERLSPSEARQLSSAEPDPELTKLLAHSDRLERQISRIIRGQIHPLDRIASVFGLSEQRLADLFGVSRPAIAKWRTRRIPRLRLADATAVDELGDLLCRRVDRPDALPGVFVTPAEIYDDRSMEEVIREGQAQALLNLTQAAFELRPYAKLFRPATAAAS